MLLTRNKGETEIEREIRGFPGFDMKKENSKEERKRSMHDLYLLD